MFHMYLNIIFRIYLFVKFHLLDTVAYVCHIFFEQIKFMLSAH